MTHPDHVPPSGVNPDRVVEYREDRRNTLNAVARRNTICPPQAAEYPEGVVAYKGGELVSPPVAAAPARLSDVAQAAFADATHQHVPLDYHQWHKNLGARPVAAEDAYFVPQMSDEVVLTDYTHAIHFTDPYLAAIMHAVASEVQRAGKLYPAHNSLHESEGVIREEFEEWWDECKVRHPDPHKVEKEAIQLAAMAVRSIYDLGPTYKKHAPTLAEIVEGFKKQLGSMTQYQRNEYLAALQGEFGEPQPTLQERLDAMTPADRAFYLEELSHRP